MAIATSMAPALCFRRTPNLCVLSLLVAEALLWLSDRLGWLAPANVIPRTRQRLAR